jgi:hypothetical protein
MHAISATLNSRKREKTACYRPHRTWHVIKDKSSMQGTKCKARSEHGRDQRRNQIRKLGHRNGHRFVEVCVGLWLLSNWDVQLGCFPFWISTLRIKVVPAKEGHGTLPHYLCLGPLQALQRRNAQPHIASLCSHAPSHTALWWSARVFPGAHLIVSITWKKHCLRHLFRSP